MEKPYLEIKLLLSESIPVRDIMQHIQHIERIRDRRRPVLLCRGVFRIIVPIPIDHQHRHRRETGNQIERTCNRTPDQGQTARGRILGP